MAEPEYALSARALCLQIGDRTILKEASLAVSSSQRIGIVGRNGCGKSTFLRILAGEETASEGDISRRRGLIVGYLPQTFELDETMTVREAILDGASDITKLIEEFEACDPMSDRAADLEATITRLDGWLLDTRIETLMSQLRTPEADRKIAGMSGGERRRIALARALAMNPDLLMLDEPTNHLDAASIQWLGNFLGSIKSAVLLVTHDRWFLDRVCTRMVELRGGQFDTYQGNYSDYLEARADKLAAEEKAESNRQSFLRRELDWVRRGPKARTTKSKSRLDRYYDIKNTDAPLRDTDMELLLPEPPRLGNRIVLTDNLGMRYGDRQLFEGLNLDFQAGMRLGIVGPNGAGKTTLIKCIMGQIEPTDGSVEVSDLVVFNLMDQERLRLEEDKSVMENISPSENMDFGNKRMSTRGYLKRFLFPDDRMTQAITRLSGGERSRLLLAKMFMRGGNFIILDEPTNDLDLATLRVLEESLLFFPGCALVVSHDRYFLNRVCTHIMAFEPEGGVVFQVGNYDDYLDSRAAKEAALNKSAKASKAAAKNSSKGGGSEQPYTEAAGTAKPSVKKRKLTYKESQELDGMEEAILGLETEVEGLEAKFGDPDWLRDNASEIKDLSVSMQTLREKIDGSYTRWEELQAIKDGTAS